METSRPRNKLDRLDDCIRIPKIIILVLLIISILGFIGVNGFLTSQFSSFGLPYFILGSGLGYTDDIVDSALDLAFGLVYIVFSWVWVFCAIVFTCIGFRNRRVRPQSTGGTICCSITYYFFEFVFFGAIVTGLVLWWYIGGGLLVPSVCSSSYIGSIGGSFVFLRLCLTSVEYILMLVIGILSFIVFVMNIYISAIAHKESPKIRAASTTPGTATYQQPQIVYLAPIAQPIGDQRFSHYSQTHSPIPSPPPQFYNSMGNHQSMPYPPPFLAQYHEQTTMNTAPLSNQPHSRDTYSDFDAVPAAGVPYHQAETATYR